MLSKKNKKEEKFYLCDSCGEKHLKKDLFPIVDENFNKTGLYELLRF